MSANRIVNLLFCTGAAIVLCWIAFFNGFPLVYSDTGTYIESGFALEIINALVVPLALVITLLWLLLRKVADDGLLRLKMFGVLIVAAYNAAICASLATVANRFSSRLAWMVVLPAVLAIAEWFNAQRRSR